MYLLQFIGPHQVTIGEYDSQHSTWAVYTETTLLNLLEHLTFDRKMVAVFVS